MGPGAVPSGGADRVCDLELIWQPSPNFGARRGAVRPDLIVLHYTAMACASDAADWLCNPEAQVSAHYVLGRDGQLWQLVAEADRAWHAGAGAWGGDTDVNSRSIGIEIDNDGASAFPEAQIDRLVSLLQSIAGRWQVPPDRVIGHSDCAPGRKIDPGPRFPWARLVAEGLAVRADAEPGQETDMEQFLTDVRAVGYPAEASPEILLSAFRLRHRSGHDGPLDAEDCGLARSLARGLALRYGVDRGGPLA